MHEDVVEAIQLWLPINIHTALIILYKTDIDKIFVFFRSFERTTPIPFEKILSGTGVDEFFLMKREIFSLAKKTCIPTIIQMGRGLTDGNLQTHANFFCERLQGLPGRLASIYSIYRYFAYEVQYVSSSICLTDWLQNCSKLQNYIYTYTYNIVGFFGIVNRCHFWWGNPIQTGIWQLPWQYSFTLCQAMLWCHKNIILERNLTELLEDMIAVVEQEEPAVIEQVHIM